MSESKWMACLIPTRLGGSKTRRPASATRTTFQRDFDRVVFSSAFRRLHDKTQVFPMPEDDQVHSRLTHSLEVSCVGRSLGTQVGEVLIARHPALSEWVVPRDVGDIVAAACLAHDIGNPPFGHAGEDAIGRWFREHPEVAAHMTEREFSDLTAFEGNAQGFRILNRLEMPAQPGLRLTTATLAAFTKYPRESGPRPENGPLRTKKHGFFQSEREVFRELATDLGLRDRSYGAKDGSTVEAYDRHPLAYLVEAADDICYSILDLEDGFHLGYVPYERVAELLEAIAEKDAYYRKPSLSKAGWSASEAISYLRAKAINQLAGECAQAFLDGGDAFWGGDEEALADTISSSGAREEIARYSVETCYRARDVVEIELAGYEVLSTLLGELIPAVLQGRVDGKKLGKKESRFLRLLPDLPTDSNYARVLAVTDFVSALTDSGAIGMFRKLRGVSLASRRWV